MDYSRATESQVAARLNAQRAARMAKRQRIVIHAHTYQTWNGLKITNLTDYPVMLQLEPAESVVKHEDVKIPMKAVDGERVEEPR